MISKSLAKFIKSLQLKKHRKAEQCFIVEGEKSVIEVIASDFTIRLVVGTESFFEQTDINHSIEKHISSQSVLESLGTFKTNNKALAVVEIPSTDKMNLDTKGYTLLLDDINDPGNLGTIIRLADWYGISQIVASLNTADLYNPKVISATKGSFTRVNIHYADLSVMINQYQLPVYAAAMQGANVHHMQFADNGFLLMGNEANGVSQSLSGKVDHFITIPKYGKAESLNVAMATGIILDNIKRS